jgi:hypothetical protein
MFPILRIGISVASRKHSVASRKHPLAMGPRVGKFSTPIRDQAETTTRDSGFYDPSGILRLVQER